jgi:uncharacterized membrane protein
MVRLYFLTSAAFLTIDLIWLGVVARSFYGDRLAHLMRETPVWPAALAFYALYIGGILVFAVLPALQAVELWRAVALGGFLGLVAYATFDLTSLALIRDFPVTVVLVDLVWGTVLTATVAACGYGFGRWLGVA